MKILAGIATYQRIEKLNRLLESLNNSSYEDFEVVIVADNNDQATLDYFKPFNGRYIDIVSQSSQQFVIGAWNRIIKDYFIPGEYSLFLGLVDDVELLRNTIENAVNAHKKAFPDGDGVVGLHQSCPGREDYTFKWFGQTLMGRKFIERYRDVDYQVCCPYYRWSHQDEEMYQFANSLGKFQECREASLVHYHPAFIPSEMDLTHNISRSGPDSPRIKDLQTFEDRQKRGLIWGKDWRP